MTEESIDTVKDTTNQQEVCSTEKRIRKRQSSTEADGKGFKRTKTTQQPRWHNQSYMLFLALRQHTERSLPRGELIKRALELDRKISAELSLPKVFRGRTPANSASAILTNNNDHYFIPFKPEGSRSTHFKLAYEPGDTETAVQEYQKWCKKLVEHDWPYCFGIPKVDLNPVHEHYHTPVSDIDSLKAVLNAEETIPALIDEIMAESTINASQEITNNTSTESNVAADESVVDSTIAATDNSITNESKAHYTNTAENSENTTLNSSTDNNMTTSKSTTHIPDTTTGSNVVENFTNGAITTDNHNTTGESNGITTSIATTDSSVVTGEITTDNTDDISPHQSNETNNTTDKLATVDSNVEDSTTTIVEHATVETTTVEVPTTTKSPKSNKKAVVEPAPMYTLDQLDLTDIPKHWTDIVEVRPSLIPGAGNGLFAKRKLPYNTPIGFYFGVPMTEDEFDSLKDRVGRSSEYSIMYRRTVLDATDEHGEPVTDPESGRFCAFHFMNETNEAGANVAFVEGVVVNQVICWTRKDIEAGEELLVWYGADVNRYWNDKENDRPKLKREYSMTESIVQATEKVSIE